MADGAARGVGCSGKPRYIAGDMIAPMTSISFAIAFVEAGIGTSLGLLLLIFRRRITDAGLASEAVFWQSLGLATRPPSRLRRTTAHALTLVLGAAFLTAGVWRLAILILST